MTASNAYKDSTDSNFFRLNLTSNKSLQSEKSSKTLDKHTPRSVMQHMPTITELYNSKWGTSMKHYENKDKRKLTRRIRPYCDIRKSLRNISSSHHKFENLDDQQTLNKSSVFGSVKQSNADAIVFDHEDVEISSTESEDNWYDDKLTPSNRIKSTSMFNSLIHKNERMEKITFDISNAVKKVKLKAKPKEGSNWNNSSDLFKLDMKWLYKANPVPFDLQNQKENQSRALMVRMRQRRLIKQQLLLS